MGASMGFFRMQDCLLALSIEEGGDMRLQQAFQLLCCWARRLASVAALPGYPTPLGMQGRGDGGKRIGGRLNHSAGFGLVRRYIFLLAF